MPHPKHPWPVRVHLPSSRYRTRAPGRIPHRGGGRHRVVSAADHRRPEAPADYDAEWIVMMDDWTDGVGRSPQTILEDLKKGGMGAMGGGGEQAAGRRPGDVIYPYYIINGRIPDAPTSFAAKPGQRIRIRFINAGIHRLPRCAGRHKMTVTHTDGFPVVPTERSMRCCWYGRALRRHRHRGRAVCSRWWRWPRQNALAQALLSTGAGAIPEPGFRPANSTVGSAPSTCSPRRPRPGCEVHEADTDHRQTDGRPDRLPVGSTGSIRTTALPSPAEASRPTMTFTNKDPDVAPDTCMGTFQMLNDKGVGRPRTPSSCFPASLSRSP